MTGSLRKLLAKLDGWSAAKIRGSGHALLVHRTGATMTVQVGSFRRSRNEQNALAEARRRVRDAQARGLGHG